jgi:hypothetical protein
MQNIKDCYVPVQYENAFNFFKKNYVDTCGEFHPNAKIHFEDDVLTFDEGDDYHAEVWILKYSAKDDKFLMV